MMLRVCDLYYNRDMSQSDIAKIMDTPDLPLPDF